MATKSNHRFLAGLASVLVAIGAPGCKPGHDDHEHGEHAGHDEGGDAAGHAGEGEAGAHADEGPRHVELTPQQRERIGLKIAVASGGTIAVAATFPGEVVLNPDRIAHVVPRAAGIVREVAKSLGDRVAAGDVLAWIESDELAEAKLTFYAKLAELAASEIKLPRARKIFEGTNRLLALLDKEANHEALHALDHREMGDYRGTLLTAYAAYVAAKSHLERERTLHGEKITSDKALVEADAAARSAHAALIAAKDTSRYQVRLALGEAVRERQVVEFEAVAAEKRLRLKGVGDAEVAALRALVPKTASLPPDGGGPGAPSVLDTLGEEERLGWYALRAPFAGVVTDRHLTLGEKVGEEETVFTIADTGSVWVRFSVFQKDLTVVKPGQAVRVELGVGIAPRTGTIAYLSPTLDHATRTAPARAVLDNRDGTLRPGLYATVHVAVAAVEAAVVVPKSAVQVLQEEEVVFVEKGDGFEAVDVRLGRADRTRVVIESGLKPGQRYVTAGAFDLKAKIVSAGLDAHAGHGH